VRVLAGHRGLIPPRAGPLRTHLSTAARPRESVIGLWPPLQNAIDRLIPRPPELPAILSTTFTDPARLTPAMPARAGASVADPGQQVSPACIIRTGMAVAYPGRLSHCHERLQRAIRSSQACSNRASDLLVPGRQPRADVRASPGHARFPMIAMTTWPAVAVPPMS